MQQNKCMCSGRQQASWPELTACPCHFYSRAFLSESNKVQQSKRAHKQAAAAAPGSSSSRATKVNIVEVSRLSPNPFPNSKLAVRPPIIPSVSAAVRDLDHEARGTNRRPVLWSTSQDSSRQASSGRSSRPVACPSVVRGVAASPSSTRAHPRTAPNSQRGRNAKPRVLSSCAKGCHNDKSQRQIHELLASLSLPQQEGCARSCSCVGFPSPR